MPLFRFILAIGRVCAILVASLVLVGAGGVGVQQALAFPHPVTLTYSDFVRQRPKAGWFVVTGCEIETADAAWQIEKQKSESEDVPVEEIAVVYAPVHAPGKRPSTTDLVVRTQDPWMMQTARVLSGTPVEQRTRDAAKLRVRKDLNGMISDDGADDKKVQNILFQEMREKPSPGFVMLAEGEEPSLGFSIFLLILGAGLLFFVRMCYLQFRRSKEQPAARA